MSFNPIQWLKDYALMGVILVAVLACTWLGGNWALEVNAHLKTKEELARVGKAFADHLAADARSTALTANDFRKREDIMRTNAQSEKEKLDEKIAVAQRDLAVALKRLQDRPTRPTTIYVDRPVAAGAGPATPEQSCTGGMLYREDAEFLVREAAAAEGIRDELLATRNQYQLIQRQVSEASCGAPPE